MSLIDNLSDDFLWQEFLNHKKSSLLTDKIIKDYESFISNKNYKNIVNKIVMQSYTFSNPQKIIISKMGSSKKRIVYSFNDGETYILKMLSYLLYKYDSLFAPNLYSFRQNKSVRTAVSDLIQSNIKSKCAYKVDIKNYFNSIPLSNLLLNLKKDLNDEKLYSFFETLLNNKKVSYNGRNIEEEKGIMAGVPISSFLANYYLKDLDFYFYNQKIIYFRYADDIIIFDYESNINKHREYIITYLKSVGLEINTEKEFLYNPGEKFEFLGFSFDNGIIDLSNNSVKKIKGKIRRTAKGLRRWMLKKNATSEVTIKAMNRKFNRKFFGKSENDLSWKYYFFPIINTTKSLKIIDNYMQDWQRYIVTGVHNKKNLEKVPYNFLKKCNYIPLVSEYYKNN